MEHIYIYIYIYIFLDEYLGRSWKRNALLLCFSGVFIISYTFFFSSIIALFLWCIYNVLNIFLCNNTTLLIMLWLCWYYRSVLWTSKSMISSIFYFLGLKFCCIWLPADVGPLISTWTLDDKWVQYCSVIP